MRAAASCLGFEGRNFPKALSAEHCRELFDAFVPQLGLEPIEYRECAAIVFGQRLPDHRRRRVAGHSTERINDSACAHGLARYAVLLEHRVQDDERAQYFVAPLVVDGRDGPVERSNLRDVLDVVQYIEALPKADDDHLKESLLG